ncbi:MAG: flagellar basal body P-ring formation chaperone FlgA [Rhodocyclaceae bacterium]|nr:flagellar basal body P-ring formation chaperone FlgA [Rhodocyclaceae bacterium]
MRRIALIICWLASNTALAQPARVIERAIHDWFESQRAHLPGPAQIEIGALAATTQLAPCARIAIALAPQARAFGATQLVARCLDAAGWRLIVPVTIHVRAPYLVTARSLPAGKTLEEADLLEATGDLAQLPANVITAKEQALGRVTVAALAAGQPLRQEQLRAAPIIQPGQSVRVILRGAGFTVGNEGKALAAAAVGQTLKVRLDNGQIISGVVQPDGAIEVR